MGTLGHAREAHECAVYHRQCGEPQRQPPVVVPEVNTWREPEETHGGVTGRERLAVRSEGRLPQRPKYLRAPELCRVAWPRPPVTVL